MKRKDFTEIKLLTVKEIRKKVDSLRVDFEEAVWNKNMRKNKDLKAVSKIKKDIAQMLTILKQKELLSELSSAKEGVEK